MRVLAAILAFWMVLPLAVQAEQVTYRFVWQGANDYAMRGAVAFDASATHGRLVRERDVICFVITGTQRNETIGRWDLGQLTLDTSWRLHFDPVAEAFLAEGQGVRMPQAWNMNGAGTNCGPGGFGFNLGNLGQDLCRDNTPLWESQINPFRPFPAFRDDDYVFPPGACLAPDLLSHTRGRAITIPAAAVVAR